MVRGTDQPYQAPTKYLRKYFNFTVTLGLIGIDLAPWEDSLDDNREDKDGTGLRGTGL